MSSAEGADEFAIAIEGLQKTYRLGFFMHRRVAALHDLSLRIPKGSIYGLLGPNGAGKSTTIKILLDLVKPTAGVARVLGMAPGSRGVAPLVGFVPENPAPYEYLSGREFLTLSGRLAGLSGRELDDRVALMLGQVDLSGAAKLQVRRYSKGMVQRLALAHGLMTRPRLLILDEPTSGLDPIGRRQIRDLILAQREAGTTVLLCTHIIHDVETVCDRIAILVAGRRYREGSVKDLLEDERGEVEIIASGVTLSSLQEDGLKVVSSTSMGDRTLVRVEEGAAMKALAVVMAGGGRVHSMTPVRAGVEDLFLSAVREAGRTVGGEVG